MTSFFFAFFTRIRPCVLPQPCRIPPNPGSLTKKTLARHPPRVSTYYLFPFPFPNPKSLVSPATAGKKIVSSISQPQSCASQLRRFASRPTSSLASPRYQHFRCLPTLFPPTRFKLETQKGKSPAPNFATGQSLSLFFFACFHPCFFSIYLFIHSPLAKLAPRETGI